MDNRDYDKALDKCWNKFCKSKPTLSKQAGVLTLFNFIFDYLYPIEKHNLTSDAEGEGMLMCEKSKVVKLYNKFQKDGTFTCLYAAGVLDTLFGSKCLPDETQNLSNLDKTGKDCNVDSLSQDSPENCDNADRISDGNNHSHKSPDTCKCSNNVQKNNTDLGHLSRDSTNCDKRFDSILKDSFAKERRLNVAVQMIKAMMGCPEIVDRISSAEADSLLDDILHDALYLTDKLIAECEKGCDK